MKIEDFLTKGGFLRKDIDPEMKERLMEECPSPTLNTSVYMFMNGLKECKRCLTCNGMLSVQNRSVGWKDSYCGLKCVGASKIVREKVRKTNIERYGVNTFLSSEEFKTRMEGEYGSISEMFKQNNQKARKTNLERYGVEDYRVSEEFKRKRHETMMVRYGDLYSRTDEAKERNRKTNIERYGVPFYTQHEDYNEKRKKTTIEKYGVVHYSKTEEFKARVRETNKERYGVPFYTQHRDYNTKRIRTSLERFGVAHYSQSMEFDLRRKETNTLTYGSPYIFTSPHYHEKMKEFWLERISKPQRKLSDYVKGLGYDVSDNDRSVISPLEVDIYLPAIKMGFEVDGFWWHSVGEGEPLDVVWDRYNRKQGKATEKGITIHHFTDFDITHSFESVKRSVQLILSGKFEKTTSIDSHKGRKFVRESFT